MSWPLCSTSASCSVLASSCRPSVSAQSRKYVSCLVSAPRATRVSASCKHDWLSLLHKPLGDRLQLQEAYQRHAQPGVVVSKAAASLQTAEFKDSTDCELWRLLPVLLELGLHCNVQSQGLHAAGLAAALAESCHGLTQAPQSLQVWRLLHLYPGRLISHSFSCLAGWGTCSEASPAARCVAVSVPRTVARAARPGSQQLTAAGSSQPGSRWLVRSQTWL